MFANRIRKNRKRLSSWRQARAGECYRLYDADMPEYAVAVDMYGEHAACSGVPGAQAVSIPRRRRRRLEEVQAALPEALGVAAMTLSTSSVSASAAAEQYEKQGQQR